MTSTKRFGKRWTINECLQLQREFELLKLSVDEIAEKHQRTPNAIMLKLHQEGFSDYNVLYSNYYNLNNTITYETRCVDVDAEEQYTETQDDDNSIDYQDLELEEEEEEEVDLKQQVCRLEKKLNELSQLVLNQSKNKNGVFSIFS